MQYIKVLWNHRDANEPIVLYSELDDERWEVRKVEIFRDGPPGYTSAAGSRRSTRLGIEPVPLLTEISLDPEFDPVEITKEDFEEIWSMAVSAR
jgi:hypothetical protein